MTSNKDETNGSESTERSFITAGETQYDTGGDRHDNVDESRDRLVLSRRTAILSALGVAGVSLFGSQPVAADHKKPAVTDWNRHQSAQEEYSLFDLAGLNMAVMPHEQELEDFEGSGLEIEEEETLNKLTVDLGQGNLDNRYLSWNDNEKNLDFSGAAEWENEVEAFSSSGSPNSASGTASVVGGGEANNARGDYSMIPGGEANSTEGTHSFAAGKGASAPDERSFVWATGGDSSRGVDSVLFQASGGAYLAEGDLDVEDGDVGAKNNVTARTGDVTADAGNVTAENNVTANTGNVTADAGDVIADQNVSARNGDVSADDGSVTAENHLTANTGNVTADAGDVIADQNVTARNGDVEANNGDVKADNDVIATRDVIASLGNVEGDRLIAHNRVNTDTVSSGADLTLDVASSDEVIAKSDLSVEGDLHVTGTKHFVTAVETPSGPKEVAYTSVEAGKPRTEAADVADLTEGRVEIDLPEHFAMVTSEDAPLSIQVTPYASERVHPQVVERSLERIVIEDMGDGLDDYRVAYTVSGVREGYENESVVRDQ